MGRGLSDLQTFILRQALQNLEHEALLPERKRLPAHVAYWEPKAFLLGLPLAKSDMWYARAMRYSFDTRAIGKKKYSAVGVAVCKAFNRLERRGLVRHVAFGVDLTEAGQQTARELSANTPANLPQC